MVGPVVVVIELINLTMLGIPGLELTKHSVFPQTWQPGYTHIYDKELHGKVLICITESGLSISHILILSFPLFRST